MTIFERVNQCFKNILDKDVIQSTTIASLSMDSLDEVEVLMEIEEEFYNIEIEDSILDEILTVKDIVDYIDEQLEKEGV